MLFKRFRRLVFPAYILQTPDLQDDLLFLFQRKLNRRSARYGLHVKETGVYDDQTRQVVSSYQLRALNIINNDGFVGPQTAKKLGIRLIEDEEV